MRLFLLLAVAVAIAGCAATGPVRSLAEPVPTEGGLVSGIGTDVRLFKGIPYAQAPVGVLRWRAPQLAQPWAGVRDGSRFGPDCMQPAEYPELRGQGMSEDCLSLNVWTPARMSTERLPVLVWIYGGGFTYGSGSHPSYDGEALARRGIAVVTLNYRMGLFGFMAHPQLTAESTSRASGNYALMDQIAALQWVQRNIAAFGGDPKRVTVAGQSAGAMSISTLMTVEPAKGLFQQAILQSVGVMRPMASLNEAEQFGLLAGTDIAELRNLDAAILVQRLSDINPPDRDVTTARALGPIVDGALVTQADYAAYARGQHMRIPMIVGSNANEGGGIARGMPLKTAAPFRLYISRNFKGAEERALAAYPAAADADVQAALADVVSDTQFLYGTREMLRQVSTREPRLYRYVFSQDRDASGNAPIHGDELQYVFDNLSAPHRGRARPSDPSDAALAATMADTWARFVKTSDPNGGQLPVWPPYERSAEVYMEFGRTFRIEKIDRAQQLDMIRDYYATTRAIR